MRKKIIHPKTGKQVSPRFVTFGLADRTVTSVTGILINDDTGATISGTTLIKCQHPRWAISFNVKDDPLAKSYTLEVRDQNGNPLERPRKIKIKKRPRLAGIVISYPGENETVCNEYFVAYGEDDTPNADVVSAVIVNMMQGNPLQGAQYWAVEFANPDQATGRTLRVTDDQQQAAPDRTFNIDPTGC